MSNLHTDLMFGSLTHMAIGLFWLPVRLSGTHYLLNQRSGMWFWWF